MGLPLQGGSLAGAACTPPEPSAAPGPLAPAPQLAAASASTTTYTTTNTINSERPATVGSANGTLVSSLRRSASAPWVGLQRALTAAAAATAVAAGRSGRHADRSVRDASTHSRFSGASRR